MRLYRVARPAGDAANVAKTLVQLVVVWAFALGLLPWLAVVAEDALGVPRWGWAGRMPIGVVVFVAGSALGVVSAWTMATVGRGTPVPFDAARELVVVGPYRFVRNPMAVSAVVQLVGVAAVYGSGAVLALAAGGAAVWEVGIRPSEDRFLADRFGAAYEAYRSETRRWVPRLRG